MILPLPASTPAHDRPLAARAILHFYLPLALNAWLLALAGPLLNAAVTRASEPRLHLAAFWIAFTVLLLCQGICLIVHPVTAALVARRTSLGTIAIPSLLAGLGAGALRFDALLTGERSLERAA